MYIRNGFIIQRKPDACGYKGVENDNWYLNYMDDSGYFEKYFDEHIFCSWNNNEFVDCCNDIDFIYKYINESVKRNISYRVILCETKRQYPCLPDDLHLETEFLGYDYAYTGGSYYSCLNNDEYLEQILQNCKVKLNENGLCDTGKDLMNYVKARSEFIKNNPDIYLEAGEYIEYRLSVVKI